ncbi:hypothetical protein THIBAULT_217 [Mycobacterium phage Thibault]|uniref:Uncharacterized protein n=1 Tax=Mycobacterium phage Thibault TaxID=1052673 RepID=G1FGT0_9CAUD|nr:hypothetical protein CL87_gp166 [Mycobacterium phage Thibault]AEJ94094.1 hypothetical protein THIBAULT_217 [Mycobacterium phage Thibault]
MACEYVLTPSACERSLKA